MFTSKQYMRCSRALVGECCVGNDTTTISAAGVLLMSDRPPWYSYAVLLQCWSGLFSYVGCTVGFDGRHTLVPTVVISELYSAHQLVKGLYHHSNGQLRCVHLSYVRHDDFLLIVRQDGAKLQFNDLPAGNHGCTSHPGS